MTSSGGCFICVEVRVCVGMGVSFLFTGNILKICTLVDVNPFFLL